MFDFLKKISKKQEAIQEPKKIENDIYIDPDCTPRPFNEKINEFKERTKGEARYYCSINGVFYTNKGCDNVLKIDSIGKPYAFLWPVVNLINYIGPNETGLRVYLKGDENIEIYTEKEFLELARKKQREEVEKIKLGVYHRIDGLPQDENFKMVLNNRFEITGVSDIYRNPIYYFTVTTCDIEGNKAQVRTVPLSSTLLSGYAYGDPKIKVF